jgi:hypothetical protein
MPQNNWNNQNSQWFHWNETTPIACSLSGVISEFDEIQASELGSVMATPKKINEEVELRPDGWERFDRAVTAAAKSGPKHRLAKKKKTTAQGKTKKAGHKTP